MKMQQCEAVFHAAFLEFIQSHQDFVGSQAELGTIAARRLPASGTTCRQFDPHPDLRPHVQLFGVLQDQFQFRVLFNDRNHVPADLLSQQSHLDKLCILESIADDRRLSFRHGDDCQQFRLAARFQAEAEFTSVFNDFLDNFALLIDFDRIHAGVVAFVVVFLDRVAESFVEHKQSIANNAVESQQHGKIKSTHLQAFDQFLQVNRMCRIAIRMHLHVAVLADGKIAVAPARDFIHFGGVNRTPVRR